MHRQSSRREEASRCVVGSHTELPVRNFFAAFLNSAYGKTSEIASSTNAESQQSKCDIWGQLPGILAGKRNLRLGWSDFVAGRFAD